MAVLFHHRFRIFAFLFAALEPCFPIVSAMLRSVANQRAFVSFKDEFRFCCFLFEVLRMHNLWHVCMSLIKMTEASYSVKMPKWSVTGRPGEPENCPSSISLCLHREESALRWRCVIFVGRNLRERLRIVALQLILQHSPEWLRRCACFCMFSRGIELGLSAPEDRIQSSVVSELDCITISCLFLAPRGSSVPDIDLWWHLLQPTTRHHSLIHMHSFPPHLSHYAKAEVAKAASKIR